MGFFDRLKSILGGKAEDDASRQSQAPAVPEPQKRDGAAQQSQTPAFSKPTRQERYVQGQENRQTDPTWESVELHLEKALIDSGEFVILNLSYPKIPFIQATREPGPDNIGKMSLEASILDEQNGVTHVLEKVVDADECRDAFRLYFETGEVKDLDTFSPVEW